MDILTNMKGLEIDAWLQADVLVTDPPYGMAYESGWVKHRPTQAIAGDKTVEVRDAALAAWGVWLVGVGGPALDRLVARARASAGRLATPARGSCGAMTTHGVGARPRVFLAQGSEATRLCG